MPLDPMQRAPAVQGRGARSQQNYQPPQDTSLLDPIPGTDAELEAGRRRRDDGMAAADRNTHVGWRALAERTIRELAAEGREFTAEDVRLRCGRPLASHDNAMGAAIGRAARAGVIEAVGYTQATRAEAAGRVIRVWRGTGAADG